MKRTMIPTNLSIPSSCCKSTTTIIIINNFLLLITTQVLPNVLIKNN